MSHRHALRASALIATLATTAPAATTHAQTTDAAPSVAPPSVAPPASPAPASPAPASPAPASTATARPPVALALDPCIDGADEVRRLIELELRAPLRAPNAPDTTQATVSCTSGLTALRVDDPLTGKTVLRVIDLRNADPAARPRLLALAVVELLVASWSELETTPRPAVSPVGPASSPEARQAAIETVHQHATSPPTLAQSPAPSATRTAPTQSPVTPEGEAPDTDHDGTPDAPSHAPTARERPRMTAPRAAGLDGSLGLLRAAVADTSARTGFRAQILAGYGVADGFLRPAGAPGTVTVDHTSRFGSVLSLGYSPMRYVDVFASSRWDSSDTNVGTPTTIQVLTESQLGITAAYPFTRWLSVGATVALSLRSGPQGFAFSATGANMRLQSSLDLGRVLGILPLRIHGNLGYMLDQIAGTTASIEQSRREARPDFDPVVCNTPHSADPRAPRNNNAACQVEITRFERFAWRINRGDTLYWVLAIDAQINAGSAVQIRPFVEYTGTSTVMRSGYVCWRGSYGPGDDDGCLAGPSQTGSPQPAFVTFGARATVLPLMNLSVMAALDVAIGGSGPGFVREVAPVMPWTAYAGVGMAWEPSRARSHRER